MTAKQYLSQAYRLDQRIASDIEEVKNIREMAGSVSAVQYKEDRVQTSRNTEAPFIRSVEELLRLEKQVEEEIRLLSQLKTQIREVIEEIPDMDERLVLRYRYIMGMTWEQIGDELHADRTTVYRWHGNALKHVELPKRPIVI